VSGFSGEAVSGASVSIRNSGLTSESAADGRFQFDDVPAGRWTVWASHVGYRPAQETITAGAGDTSVFVLVHLTPRPVNVGGISVIDEVQPEEMEAAGRLALSAGEIRQSPGHAGDINRVMSLHPSVAKSHDAFNSLAVRGGHPSETRFIVDGFVVPNINHFPLPGSSAGSYSLIRADLVRRLNFSPGGEPAYHGGYLSGLMDIELRRGRSDRIGGTVGAGLAGLFTDLEGPLPGIKGSWLISLRKSFINWLAESVDAGVAPEYEDAVAKVVIELNPSHCLNLLGLYGTDDLVITPEMSRAENYGFVGDVAATEWTAGVRWQSRWHRRFTSSMTVSAASIDHGVDLDRRLSDSPYARDHSNHTTGRLGLLGSWHVVSGWNVQVSADWSQTTNDIEFSARQVEGPLGYQMSTPLVDLSVSATELGLSISNRVMLNDAVECAAGLRADRFETDLYDSGDGWYLAPRLGLTWHPAADWEVMTGLGWYYQPLPIRLPLQARFVDSLSHPSVRSLNVGVRYRRAGVSVSLEAYHKYYDGFPLDPTYWGVTFPFDQLGNYYVSVPYGALIDSGKAEAYGCELVLKRNYVGGVYGVLALGLSNSHYQDLRGVWRPRYYQTDFSFGVEGGVDLGRGVTASLRLQVHSGAPVTPIDSVLSDSYQETILKPRDFKQSNLPTYYNANLKVEKSVALESTELTMYASIWNLFDNKRVLEYYWNSRTHSREARYEWGLIPIIGIEWKF
jgi:hypothetical protein